MRIYTIEWSDCEGHAQLAAFSTEAARDETFAKIEAIPWHEKPGYIGHDDWAEKAVSFHEDSTYGREWRRDNGIHGTIYKDEFEVHDGPIEVYDRTNRTPFVRKSGKR